MKYGQLPKSTFQEKNNLKLNQWIELDMSPANLRKNGFKAKRGWNGVIEFKITHLFDSYFVALSGSNDNMCFPYSFIKNS